MLKFFLYVMSFCAGAMAQGHWEVVTHAGNRQLSRMSFVDAQTGWAGKVINSGNAAMYKWNGPLSDLTDQQPASGTFTCFPNPSKDEIKIRLENEWSGQLELQLLHTDGKVLRTLSLEKWEQPLEHSLPVSDLAPGMYWINLRKGGQQRAVSFTKL